MTKEFKEIWQKFEKFWQWLLRVVLLLFVYCWIKPIDFNIISWKTPIIVFLVFLFVGYIANSPKNPIIYETVTSHNDYLEKRRVEGLKALADWSKWIITIQASFIAFITLKLGKDINLEKIIPNINLAILSFALSILAATILLGAIPGALASNKIELPKEPSKDIYKYKYFLFSIGAFAFTEHLMFLLGMLYVILSLIKN
jgi:hypothetical protein